MQNSETPSILPFQLDFFDELHEIPNFAAIIVLEEVVALLRLGGMQHGHS